MDAAGARSLLDEPVTGVLCKQFISGHSGKGICISLTRRLPIEPGAVLVAPTMKKEQS